MESTQERLPQACSFSKTARDLIHGRCILPYYHQAIPRRHKIISDSSREISTAFSCYYSLHMLPQSFIIIFSTRKNKNETKITYLALGEDAEKLCRILLFPSCATLPASHCKVFVRNITIFQFVSKFKVRNRNTYLLNQSNYLRHIV